MPSWFSPIPPFSAVTATYKSDSDIIPAYTDGIYYYYFPGALDAWAHLDYSSGPVGFAYYFSNNQILYVIISNGNAYFVYAIWTTCFVWN